MFELQNMIKDIVRKAIIRFAKKNDANVGDVKLNAYLTDRGMHYALWIKDHAVQPLTFNDILGVSFDLLNREEIVTPTLINGLLISAEENKIKPAMANLFFGLVLLSGENGNSQYGYTVDLYNGHNFVCRMSSDQFTTNFGIEMTLADKGG